MSTARSSVDAENDDVRITTWTFAATGASTGQHRHEFDYVVVPITGGTFKVTGVDGAVREMTQVAAAPYLGVAGTAHDVASASPHEVVFVEIELKAKQRR
ncbi:MAG: beta-alanine degradation protein BauB [Ilumatobacteraceae bacterium]|jgi:quercetin dioxygenase-like cupin family protein|nr:beta-alanine degradation protein BauB [Ilumatobacteraceae bacterium]